jgi:hypothetical protein
MSKPENYRLHCHDYQKITAFGNPETQARRGLEEHITIITLFFNISPCLYFRGGLRGFKTYRGIVIWEKTVIMVIGPFQSVTMRILILPRTVINR